MQGRLFLASSVVTEAEFVLVLVPKKIPAVEKAGRFAHVLVEGREIERAEFVPNGEQGDGVGPIGCRGAEEATSAFAVNSL